MGTLLLALTIQDKGWALDPPRTIDTKAWGRHLKGIFHWKEICLTGEPDKRGAVHFKSEPYHIHMKMSKWSSWKTIVSFNYLLIAREFLPTHAYNLLVVMCHSNLHLWASAVTNWKIYLQQRSFLVKCKFPKMFKLQFGLSTLFLLHSFVEFKGLEDLLTATNLLLHNLWFSLWC